MLVARAAPPVRFEPRQLPETIWPLRTSRRQSWSFLPDWPV